MQLSQKHSGFFFIITTFVCKINRLVPGNQYEPGHLGNQFPGCPNFAHVSKMHRWKIYANNFCYKYRPVNAIFSWRLNCISVLLIWHSILTNQILNYVQLTCPELEYNIFWEMQPSPLQRNKRNLSMITNGLSIKIHLSFSMLPSMQVFGEILVEIPCQFWNPVKWYKINYFIRIQSWLPSIFQWLVILSVLYWTCQCWCHIGERWCNFGMAMSICVIYKLPDPWL